MSRFFISMLSTIMVLLAMVTNGILERILWIVSAILIGRLFTKCKEILKVKKSYKNIMIGMLSGYTLTIILLVSLQYPLDEVHAPQNYVSTNRTAIVMIFPGEPSKYDISLAIKNYIKKTSPWEIIWMPFKLFKEKVYYEKVDSISEEYFSMRLKRQMEKELDEIYNVYNAYLYNKPYLEEIIKQVMVDGNEKIIFCPILLTESKDYIKGREDIKRLNLQHYRVETHITQPLWNSDIIARSFINEVNQSRTSDHKHNIGIILVGENITERNYYNPNIKQDLLFREKVKDFLIRDGYNNNKISIAAFEKKDIKNEIEKQMEYGVGEIIIVPVATDLYDISSQVKIKRVMKRIKTPYTVEVYSINPWIYNDDIVKELINRIALLNL